MNRVLCKECEVMSDRLEVIAFNRTEITIAELWGLIDGLRRLQKLSELEIQRLMKSNQWNKP